MIAPALVPPEAPLTDEQLLVRFRDSGDEAAFEMLVRRYERRLFGFLRRRLRSVELAEDVFQRVVVGPAVGAALVKSKLDVP